VVAELDKSGSIFCGAFAQESPPAGVFEVKKQEFTGKQYLAEGGFTNLTISGLTAGQPYALFCYTEDFTSHAMETSDMLSTRVDTETSCCRQLQWLDISETLEQLTSTNDLDTITPAWRFKIDPPSAQFGAVVMRFDVRHCSVTDGGSPSAVNLDELPRLAPDIFDFRLGPGAIFEGTFVLRPAYAGCFDIVASRFRTQDVYDLPTQRVTVLPRGEIPGTAKLARAQYADDGFSFQLFFNTSTDRANHTLPVACDSFLDFRGVNASQCVWNTDSSLHAYISGGIGPSIGDPIRSKAGVLRTQCDSTSSGFDCRKRVASPASQVLLQGPLAPLAPKVVITTSGRLAACSDMVLDPTNTFGNAGRPWKNLKWVVTSCCRLDNRGHEIYVDTSAIEAFLNAHYAHTDFKAVVPNAMLTRDTKYTVVLRVENMLGASSQGEIDVQVVRDYGTPVISVYPGVETSIYRWQPLSLFVSALRPACADTHGTYTIALEYEWSLFKDRAFIPQMKSTNNNPRYFSLPAYALEVKQRYKVLFLLIFWPISAQDH
jgi:hypothetical protein